MALSCRGRPSLGWLLRVTSPIVLAVVLLLSLIGWMILRDFLYLAALTPRTGLSIPEPPLQRRAFSSTTQDSKFQLRNAGLKQSGSYGELALSFEANQGQVDSRVQFFSRDCRYNLFLTATEAVLQLPIGDDQFQVGKPSPTIGQELDLIPEFGYFKQQSQIGNRPLPVHHPESAILRMKWVDANRHSQIVGLEPLPGKSNYFVGNDPKHWHTEVPRFARVEYQDIYPGVNLVFYGDQRQVEYDLVVAPGTDPSCIQLVFEGADVIRADSDGDLILKLAGTEIRQRQPQVYQQVAGFRRSISGCYVKQGKHEVGFEVATYDRNLPLVIDPVLVFSNSLSTNDGISVVSAVVADTSGNTYVLGVTTSLSFPTTAGALQPDYEQGTCGYADGNLPCPDLFVVKFNPQGNTRLYSTYLGGNGSDDSGGLGDGVGGGIAIDSQGNAYLTGTTSSTDFPVTENVLQSKLNQGFTCNSGRLDPCRDAFVLKLNSGGTALLYSSYLGGDQDKTARGITLDSRGNAYVALNVLGFYGNPIAGLVSKIADQSQLYAPAEFFVPFVFSGSGRNHSQFKSELTLTNRGVKDTDVQYTYTAAFGGGSGTVSETLPAGQQRIIPDAVSYLRTEGLLVPDTGDRGGTLRVRFSDPAIYSDVSVNVRTVTSGPDGHVAEAYPAVPVWETLALPSYLCGLRQDSTYRSNLALQNAGSPAEGDIVVRLTLFSGNPAASFSQVLPDVTLAPGGFRQISGILQSNGMDLSSGYVGIERVSATAPYYAYAVINHQSSSDSSFIFPTVPEERNENGLRAFPVILGTSRFASELTLANLSSYSQALIFNFAADAIQSPDHFTSVNILLKPGEQSAISDFIQYLREHDIPGVSALDRDYIGWLVL